MSTKTQPHNPTDAPTTKDEVIRQLKAELEHQYKCLIGANASIHKEKSEQSCQFGYKLSIKETKINELQCENANLKAQLDKQHEELQSIKLAMLNLINQ